MFTSVDRLFDSRSDFVPNLYDLSLYIVLSSFTHRRLTAQLFFGIGSHPGVTPGIKPPTLDKNQVYQLIQSHSDLRKDGGGRVQYLHYFLLALCAQVNPLFLAAPSASWLTDEMPLRLYASTNRGVKGGRVEWGEANSFYNRLWRFSALSQKVLEYICQEVSISPNTFSLLLA